MIDETENIDQLYDALKKRFAEVCQRNETLEARNKELKAEMKRVRDVWEETFNSVSDLMYVLADDGTIVHANRATLERLGLPQEQILGRYCYEVVGGAGEPPDQFLKLLTLENGIQYSTDLYLDQLKGHFTVTGTPLRNAAGFKVGSVHICHDITERKRAEAALMQSERNYRELIEYARTVILRWDVNGEVTYINDFGERCFGFKRFELIGRPLVDSIVPASDSAGKDMRQLIHDIIRFPAEHNEIEYENLTRDGRRIWMHWNNTAVYEKDGSLVEILSIGNDVTARKEAEDRLHETNHYLELAVQRSNELAAEAARANVAKSEFLANMSHEIRTPMSGVIGNAQLLRFTNLSEEQGRLLENIETDANNLISLINDILDISKIEAGKLELEETRFSVRDCITTLLKSQESRIHRKGLSLVTDIDGAVPDSLHGDQLRLKQILYNLLGNAIKFTERGDIGVRVELLERDGDRVLVCVSISDTGIGIKPDALEKIFAPFSQADSSVTRRFGGTGLGLSICSRLVRMMSGTLSVESREGVGSTFRVTLPFRISAQPAAVQEPEQTTGAVPTWDGTPLRILLAEDSITNRTMLASLLRHFGHDVTACGDGTEALVQWRSAIFDIILMDIQMPIMDGEEALRCIREHETQNGGHMPVIALTAHALLEQKNHLLVSGFDGYVSKPIEWAALNAEMKRVLGSCARGVAANGEHPG